MQIRREENIVEKIKGNHRSESQAAQAQCERLIINTCGFILRNLKWP